MVIIAAAVVGIAAASLIYWKAIRHTSNCEGTSIKNMKGNECGAGVDAKQAAPVDPNTATIAQVTGNGIVCDKMGCKGGNCFAAGTLVPTAAGLRPIETLKEGEQVLAADEENLNVALAPIEKVVVTENKSIMELVLRNGEERETLRVTPDHAFWIDGRSWVRAIELVEGDLLHTDGIREVRVVATKPPTEKTTVYNLEVAKVHTYFVGKSTVLSHYACERMLPTETLRKAATDGPLWSKPRFDALSKLAACRDLTAGDYGMLAAAVAGEAQAKEDYLRTMKESGRYESDADKKGVDEALARRWFDRAEQALRAGIAEGDPAAAAAAKAANLSLAP